MRCDDANKRIADYCTEVMAKNFKMKIFIRKKIFSDRRTKT